MIDEDHPVLLSAFLGTLLTWGMTAFGAFMVFIIRKPKRLFLDISLGFAGGVMTAASFWSLLSPALELSEESGTYGRFSFIPSAIGFVLGAGFILGTDIILKKYGLSDTSSAFHEMQGAAETGIKLQSAKNSDGTESKAPTDDKSKSQSNSGLKLSGGWGRMILLVIAITVHNIPEGMAVGVAFGAVGKSESATFQNARSLAIGMSIQNFPEGLAVSLPLRAMGMASWKAFLWGQFSGIVEPIFGVLGCITVTAVEPILSYALAFAAGAMIWVVYDDLIAEGVSAGNGKISSCGAILGFTIMMILDVFFGDPTLFGEEVSQLVNGTSSG